MRRKHPARLHSDIFLINNVINVLHLQIVTMNENYSFCHAQAFKELLMFYNFSYLRVEPRTQAAQHPPPVALLLFCFCSSDDPSCPGQAFKFRHTHSLFCPRNTASLNVEQLQLQTLCTSTHIVLWVNKSIYISENMPCNSSKTLSVRSGAAVMTLLLACQRESPLEKSWQITSRPVILETLFTFIFEKHTHIYIFRW